MGGDCLEVSGPARTRPRIKIQAHLEHGACSSNSHYVLITEGLRFASFCDETGKFLF